MHKNYRTYKGFDIRRIEAVDFFPFGNYMGLRWKATGNGKTYRADTLQGLKNIINNNI